MKNIILLFLMLIIENSAFSQDFRKKAPAGGPAPKVQIGSYETFKLENGLQIIVVENHKLPRVSFQLFLDNDPVLEKDAVGYVGVMGQMLGKGTTKRTKSQIDEEIDFMGASLGASASGFYGQCLKKHADKLIEIASDAVLQPSFPKDEFDKSKKQLLSGLASSKENADAIASNVSKVMRNGRKHPYGEVTTDASVEKITLELCKSYYETYFRPDNGYFIIVGDITPTEAKSLISKYFGAWKKGNIPKNNFEMPAKPSSTQVDFVSKVGAVQSVIAVTFPVDYKIGVEDAAAADVMNGILGGGVFSGRLMQNLREKHAYTYGARSSLGTDKRIGRFSAGASVRNVVTDSSVTELMSEIRKIRDEKVSDTELSTVKNYMAGAFARSLEEPRTVADFALNTARFNLPKDYYANYLQRLSAVKAEDVQAAAKKYLFPEQAHIVVVGSKDQAEKLKVFSKEGKINYFDNYGNVIEQKEDSKNVTNSTISPENIISNYIAAIGGAKKIASVKDMTVTMKTEMQGMKLEITRTAKSPNLYSMSVKMNGSVMQSQIFDGAKGNTLAMGQKVDMDEDDIENAKTESKMFKEAAYLLKENAYKLTYKGVENLDGAETQTVQVISPRGKESLLFFDAKTGLKVREISTRKVKDDIKTLTTDYKDYKEIDGIKIPHTLVSSGSMPMPMTLELLSAKFNSNLDSKIFKLD